MKNNTYWVHHSPRRSCFPAHFVWTEWPWRHSDCPTETARNEGGRETRQQDMMMAAARKGEQVQLDSIHKHWAGKSFFFFLLEVLGKNSGRGNMNMKMRRRLRGTLTQAALSLWCLPVLIRDTPHCGAPVWQPPTCDSLKWARRSGRINVGKGKMSVKTEGKWELWSNDCMIRC